MDVPGYLAMMSLAAAFVTLASVAVAAHRLRRRPVSLFGADDHPPVTIVRPLCGREPFSELTLRSGFRLDYPDYELVFCVASRQDPVVAVVQRLMAAHPAVPARLLVGDDPISRNPKLNNCVKGWHAARRDWILLADSNVEMPRDALQRLLAAWRPESGLVCSMPIGTRPAGFWAALECAFLNTFQARWQYAGEAVGAGFAQGKSMLWHRRLLDRHGGIEALGREIAEDAAATKLVKAAGFRVHLVDRPFPQPLGRRRLGEVWTRQLRWARLRRLTFPLLFLPEIFSSPLLLGAAMALGASPLGLTPWLGAALPALCWGAEAALARQAGWPLGWRIILAFPLRDAMVPAIWLGAFLPRDIVWHGKPLQVGRTTAHGDELTAAGARP